MQADTYTAVTASGTILCVDKVSQNLIHARENGTEQVPALIHVPKHSRSAFILFDNPDLTPFSTLDRKPSGPIIPLRWLPMPDDAVAFFEPSFQSYLVAIPKLSAAGVGTIKLVAPEMDQGKSFKLVKASDRILTGAIRHQVELIQRVVAPPPISILDLLRDVSAADRPTVASLLVGILLPSEIELFVDYLFEDRERLNTFASFFPNDPWAVTALPSLFDFIRLRHVKETIRPKVGYPTAVSTQNLVKHSIIGPELDQLALAGLPGEPLAFTHQCAITARSKVPPMRDFCIIATARNDGLYILDWLAYHQAIGVDRVFLYTNDNADGSAELLHALASAGELSLIESKLSVDGVSPVSKAYGHALSLLPDILDYRWCAVIDSDEYIGIDRHLFGSLRKYVEWQELKHVDVIFLNWVMFGSSGALRWKDELLPVRFQEKYLDVHVKSMFRPRFFHHAFPHFPYTRLIPNITSRNAAGDLHPSFAVHSPQPRDNPAWIAHYFYRSVEEFVWKFSRGRGDQPLLAALQRAEIPEGFMKSFIAQQNELRLVRDERVLAFADDTVNHVSRLKALPGVPEALAAIHDHYRRRSEVLEPTLRALRPTASPIQSEFYDLLLTSY